MDGERDDDALTGIAIVGMSLRAPGAPSAEALWKNVCEGVESITHFSKEELAREGVPAAVLEDPHYVRAKGIIDGPELFDAAFFGMSPREAATTDPQHRLFLECAWEALEHAGYTPDGHDLTVGVYAGSGGMSTYFLHNLARQLSSVDVAEAYQLFIGNDKDFLPTRVAYKLNLKGPAVAVQTACSTSLVAISMACQALVDYQCDLALAGAAAVPYPHVSGYLHRDGMILSPDGHCRAFDAAAQGIVPGSGVGVVALRRLEEAIADGDVIHAVIKGWAVNNDGSAKAGYTAPGVDGQAEVIAAAQALAGVSPRAIGYVEAHGTGTPLGDPIEIAALTQAFRAETDARGFCAIGSLKTNIGHLDVAAGVAGLIKAVMALRHRRIPPSLNFERPNPAIDFTSSPFYVSTRASEWKSEGEPRRAGVSSFGIGGTNAHVVLEEAPTQPAASSSAGAPQLLVLSAKSAEALDDAAVRLAEHLERRSDLDLADVAHTLQTGRKGFRHRAALVCAATSEVPGRLASPDPKLVIRGDVEGSSSRVAFMFSGQGAQHARMGADLYRAYATFRRSIDECADTLRPEIGRNLSDLLFSGERGSAEAWLEDTSLVQPALFAIEYALAQLWMSWGSTPHAMIGHSVGEYAAACLAGVMSLKSALTLVAARGRLMQGLPRGAMLAVPCPEDELATLLSPPVSIAAVNAPSLCVASGPPDALAALQERLAARGIKATPVRTSHAFHSAAMDPILGSFVAEANKVAFKPPSIPYVSATTGRWITPAEACDPTYWARQIREPVRFSDGLRTMLQDRSLALLEVGPGRTLASASRRRPDLGEGRLVTHSLPHPNDGAGDVESLLRAAGRLWCAGIDLDFRAMHEGESRRRVELPTYPFQRRRYVVAQSSSRTALRKRADIADWLYVPLWKQTPPRAFGDAAAAAMRTWVFEDELGLGSALAQRLRRGGHEVTVIVPGEVAPEVGSGISRRDDGAFIIDPTRRDAYEALLAAAGPPDRVAHLWSVTRDERRTFEETQTLGLYSALALVRALSRASAHAIGLWFFANRTHTVSGEKRSPAKAPLRAVVNGVSQEYPHVQASLVDIADLEEPALVDRLLTEISSPPEDVCVALRGARRWVQVLEPVRPRLERDIAGALSSCRTWLITGGMGGVGLTLAAHLAEEPGTRLVLVGRSEMPPREAWERWLAEHDGDVVSRKIRRLIGIEQLGAEVVLARADVADEAALRAIVVDARRRFGSIDGVIHAAGVLDPAAFPALGETDPAACRAHFRAKVDGLLSLARALDDEGEGGHPPRLRILLSSLSCALGGLGMTAYAAANQFLDAYADESGGAWMAIDSDGWSLPGDRPAAGGMADLVMSPAEGVRAIEAALTLAGLPQVLISTADLHARLDQWQRRRPRDLEMRSGAHAGALDPEPQTPARAQARPRMSTSYEEPQGDLERAITRVFGDALGVAQVGRHDDFFELGGDSLLAVHVIAKLREVAFGDLSPQLLIASPTASSLAHALSHRGAAAAAATSGGPSPLVQIQPGNGKTPLFLVHPVGGHVFLYRDLAVHLGPDQPVYAFQARGLTDGREPVASVEEMARAYLDALLSVQGEGPYLLGGSSFGGTVAFEMAQQLTSRGREVAVLALLDTPGGGDLPEEMEADDAAIIAYLLGIGLEERASLEELERLDADERLRRVLARSEELRIPPDLGLDDLRRALVVFKANVRAMRRYSPRVYPGRLVFFRAVERDAINPHHPEAAWVDRAERGMDLHEVPGDHLSMNRSPHVRAIAERLRAHILAALG